VVDHLQQSDVDAGQVPYGRIRRRPIRRQIVVHDGRERVGIGCVAHDRDSDTDETEREQIVARIDDRERQQRRFVFEVVFGSKHDPPMVERFAYGCGINEKEKKKEEKGWNATERERRDVFFFDDSTRLDSRC